MHNRTIPGKPGVGLLYFYVHFVTEVICFFSLTRITGDNLILWLFPLIYDAIAFVPQSLIGYISDKCPKLNFGLIGSVLLSVACLMYGFSVPGKYTALIVLCIGNACTHVGGAEATLRTSDGHLSSPAIFVAGGSFGVISGKLLASTQIGHGILAVLALTAIPFVLLAELYRKETEADDNPCSGFDCNRKSVPATAVILTAVLVIIVRGYMGYGIPTSWNKTVFQTVMLYVTMGIGKALGGILSDTIGIRKTALISTSAALPFLLAGDNHMLVSLVGVMFFSMTMSITLAMLVSVLQKTPGLAFGITTISLFLGSAPIFFFRLATFKASCIFITTMTVLCFAALALTLRKDVSANE